MAILAGNIAEQVISAVIVETGKPIFKGVGKMGELRINLTNFLIVGLMAFIAVWAVNRGLAKANMSQYQA
jgi:large-conductance mechanosensitive channel